MSTTVQEAVAPSAEGTGDTKMLAGFAGFGSFMQETSVQTLVTQRDSDYKAPTLPISTDPCDYEFNPAAGFGKKQRQNFLLGDEFFFVNHGAFGAAARPVFEAAQAWRRYAEIQPLKFIDRELLPLLVHVVRQFAPEVGAAATDLVFVPTATVGLNTVIDAAAREWTEGDEVLSLSVGYSSVRKMLDIRCQSRGVRHVTVNVPMPVASSDQIVEAVQQAIGPRTRFAVFDHVTSNTALVLPVAQLTKACHARGVKVLIDGAHAPGMVDLNLTDLGADWYVANLHKWYCCPRGTAFLWSRPEHHALLKPLVISHGSGDGLTSAFIWDGNRDYSGVLSVLTAIRMWHMWGKDAAMRFMYDTVREAAKTLAGAWGTGVLAPWEMVGSMAMVEVPAACAGIGITDEAYPAHAKYVQDTLFHTFKVEVPVKVVSGKLYVRISAHVYNHPVDYRALSSAITTMRDTNLGKVIVCTKGGGCA
eukprot:m.34110 g.34110  ORF g.34110 m.34110 type:complete len:475 (+) comp5103_c0_seq1:217-1641(+)